MSNTIAIIQIIIAVLLAVLILLQQRGGDAGGFLGGSSGSDSGFYQQRRGMDKFFFVSTIVLVIAFAGLALGSLFYHPEQTVPTNETTTASSTPEATGAATSSIE